jgi:hypothetical protein
MHDATVGPVEVTLHILIGALLLGAILPSLAAPSSMLRQVRFIFIFALYPVFVALALIQGVVAPVLWIGLAGITLMLELVADRLLPTKDSLYARWKTWLLWPVMLPAVLEALLIHLRLAPKHLDVSLPPPPRGSQLFSQSDDELLVAVYQILAEPRELTQEEQTIWLAETFSREIHGGGLFQWFCNTQDSMPETVAALRTVGAPATAAILQQAGELLPAPWDSDQTLSTRQSALRPVEPALRTLDGRLLTAHSPEDLTSLIARYVRQNRRRCPALETPT